MKELRHKAFANGIVYALETDDGFPIETTDTFLPIETRDAIGRHQNALSSRNLGSRAERWMIGVSVMSGCPVRCKFCATGSLKRWRRLTASEIVEQFSFVLGRRSERFGDAMEHKINYTRMGEPFLNLDAVRHAITSIEAAWPGTHHYVSTIGVKGSDFSWIRDNITLQISLHALDEKRRDELIPWNNKLSISDLGKIRTGSRLKTTLNLTLCEERDFDIDMLKKHFDPAYFFVKLSPINPNAVSDAHGLGNGVIMGVNMQ
ncbi:MAG: radical SAM protein [Opitutaceae bacterium]|jgi:23S rRNA (adenine2503-C2)-methyltransferase